MMETPAAPDRTAHERKFIEDLAQWLKDDNGKAAALRRNAGSCIAESKNVALFYSLPNILGNPWHEDTYFLVATLFASDKGALDGPGKFQGDFGATLRALRNASGASPSDPSPLDRRFNVLLDSDFDPQTGGKLAYQLRQMTKRLIALKDPAVRIDWAQLLYDIKHWNNEDRWIQKKWARSYYAPSLNSVENNTSEPNTEE